MYYMDVAQRFELVADADETMAILTGILAGINDDTAHLKKLVEVGSDEHSTDRIPW